MTKAQLVKESMYRQAEVCESCGNIFKILWLKTGDDYNDFGMRHCPFCGILYKEGF